MNEAQVKKLGDHLVKEHLSAEWSFGFCNAASYIGFCNYRAKQIRFSKKYLHVSDDEVLDTLLHEIAHALTPGAKHGVEWRNVARSIGVVNIASVAKNVKRVEGKWDICCSECGSVVIRGRHRRSNMDGKRHVGCTGPLVWRENERV